MSITRTSVSEARQKADLGTDQAGVLVRFGTVEERDFDAASKLELPIQLHFDGFPILRIPLRNLEVEPTFPRRHVPAGHGALEPLPHDPAHGVHRGVGPHQCVAAVPIDLADHLRADRRQGVEPVPHTS